MITYGVNDNEKVFVNSSNRPVSRIEELQKQRISKLRVIEDCKKLLARHEKELKEIDKEFYVLANLEISKEYTARGQELSKKDLIIEYYKLNVPQERIAEAVEVTQNYVSKVLSEYRKQNGLENVTKGQKTKQRIIQCLSSGMSINKTATAVNVTPQYVCAVKKEYENNRV